MPSDVWWGCGKETVMPDGRVFCYGYEVKGDKIMMNDYSPDFFKELCWTPTTSPSTKDTQNEMGSPTKKPHSR
jgi:hypothetical protein